MILTTKFNTKFENEKEKEFSLFISILYYF